MRPRPLFALCLALPFASAVVLASARDGMARTAPDPSLAALVEAAAHRFPQPVRVGALIGRDVLEPVEAQPVLGHVVALTGRPDGGQDMVIRTGGTLGFGGRLVAVPIEAVALLGEYVALMAYTPAQFGALPTVEVPGAGAPGGEVAGAGAPGRALPPDAVIEVGIVRPFH